MSARSSWAQMSRAIGLRVRNRQPLGGSTGEGTSPVRPARLLAPAVDDGAISWRLNPSKAMTDT